jgi:hypothetical protein
MEKQLGNSGKMKKPFWPKPAHQARALAAPDRRTPPVGANLPLALFSLSRSLPSGAELSAPVPFAHAPLFTLCLTGPLCQVPSRYPRALVLSLSLCVRAYTVSSDLPAPAVDQRARTRASRRNPRPRRPPHMPQLPFSAQPAPTLTPPPHFAQPHPLSHSAHAAIPR